MIFTAFRTIRVFGYSWSTRKPRFLMDQRPLVEWRIVNFFIFLYVFEFLRFRWFFPFFNKFRFLGILGPPYCVSCPTSGVWQPTPCTLFCLETSMNEQSLLCVQLYTITYHTFYTLNGEKQTRTVQLTALQISLSSIYFTCSHKYLNWSWNFDILYLL